MKYLIASLFVLLFFVGHANDKLGIIAKVPNSMLPGQTYNVEILINKGDLASYAYFEQDLPAGMLAKQAVNDNGDFEFETGTLKIIWLRLPEKSNMRIVYSVQAPSDTVGYFYIGGTFNYIVGNKRGQVELTKVRVAVGTPEQIAELDKKQATSNTNFSVNAIESAQVEVLREEPSYMSFDNSYTVILLIKKHVNLPLTIEETVPNGYKASAVQVADAKFAFKDNKVTFDWDVMPDKDLFTVTYQLTKLNNKADKDFEISGKFTYKLGPKAYSFYIDKNYDKQINKPDLEQILKIQELQQRVIDAGTYGQPTNVQPTNVQPNGGSVSPTNVEDNGSPSGSGSTTAPVNSTTVPANNTTPSFMRPNPDFPILNATTTTPVVKDEKPTTGNTTPPAEVKSTEVKPVETKPTEVKPAETKPEPVRMEEGDVKTFF